MIVFRHCDPRVPFLWESRAQPEERWHATGTGPAHYFADTPDGAWAEFLRHEEIRDPTELEGVRRALWAIEIEGLPRTAPRLPRRVQTGGRDTYQTCRREATRLRARGATGLVAPSAALAPGAAGGWRVQGGLRPAPARDGRVIVFFGRRPDLTGWPVVERGAPPEDTLARVRHFA